ncbi:DUF7344 domain-containing protein [Natronobeatus ordinarius]|uniref:DUF7344 domain-containing protein n=1 Tax=Natronobeatus ordinarius TaxID=2963433 RepID=UPI0020CBB2DE|nr:hypothetical protein [Natronobeatus ordinarius]
MGTKTIDDDELFDALADSRRRQLLVELLTHNPQHVPELSRKSQEIAKADEKLFQQHLSSSRTIPGVDEGLLRLHYIHLPKLADYGFIEWDRNTHVVTKGPRFDEMRPLLEPLIDQQKEETVVLLRE